MKKVICFCLILIFCSIQYASAQAQASINIGDYVQMGSYYNKPILWRCIGIDENGVLMLSDKSICVKAFDMAGDSGSHSRAPGDRKDGSSYWGDSNIRSWLNSNAPAGNVEWLCGNPPSSQNDSNGYGMNLYSDEAGFLTNFTSDELSAILEVSQMTHVAWPEYENRIYSTGTHKGYDDTSYAEYFTDKIFLLDLNQYKMISANQSILGDNYYFSRASQEAIDNSTPQVTGDHISPDFWWLRTPMVTNGKYYAYAFAVYCGGYSASASLESVYNSYNVGVRPAFYINQNRVDFQSGTGLETLPYLLKKDTEASLWAKNEIEKAISFGIVSHEQQNYYQENISREDFCELLTRFIEIKTGETIQTVMKKKGVSSNPLFSDTQNENVIYMASLGIVKGVGNNMFLPYGDITREEAAVLLARTATVLDYDVSYVGNVDEDVSSWAKDGVGFVIERGIMNGMGNCFNPHKMYTKEQAIATLLRMYNNLK